jgi:hypothetical protein
LLFRNSYYWALALPIGAPMAVSFAAIPVVAYPV